MAYCKAEFQLSKKGPDDKYTKRQHYEASGISRDKWGIPDPPTALLHIWGMYLKVSARRQSGMGFNPITYTELDSFLRLSNLELKQWEIDLFFAIDDLARSVFS